MTEKKVPKVIKEFPGKKVEQYRKTHGELPAESKKVKCIFYKQDCICNGTAVVPSDCT